MKRNDRVECAIASLAFGGRGVARVDGRVIFVEGAVPGQTVLAEVTKVGKRFAEASAVEVLVQSPDFVEPFCRHFGECGGCAHQDMAYAAQLREKETQVSDAMRRIGCLEFESVEPILPSPNERRYRNKMEFAFAGRGQGLELGLRERGGKRVVDLATCHLVHEDAVAVLHEARAFCAGTGIPAYDPKTRKGFWRHLVVRRSEASGELMAHLITAHEPSAFEAAEALGKTLAETLDLDRFVHSTRRSNAEIAFGEREVAVLGGRRIEERLVVGGRELRYALSADAFFQPNSGAAAALYETVLEFAGLTGTEKVLDLYCGTGGIGLALAGRAGSVAGVELSEAAVADARLNARLNGLTNCTFTALDLEGEPGALTTLDTFARPDVIVTDPPRGGLSAEVCDAIRALAPERIVAVSCDPPALARDAARLGYRALRLRAVDQFPHTPHVECVALLGRP
jgi:23S rRNA (uracil1939-C5)-methyltransferase